MHGVAAVSRAGVPTSVAAAGKNLAAVSRVERVAH